MSKIKKLFTNARILIYIAFFVMMIVAINPHPNNKGATIRNIIVNSTAYQAGIVASSPNTPPVAKTRIIDINGVPINTAADYEAFVSPLKPNRTLTITTETIKFMFVKERTVHSPMRTRAIIEDGEVIGTDDLGITVYDAPKSNIRLGLDLQGGTRVVLKPEEKLSFSDVDALVSNMNQRLNLFGLSDVVIRSAGDLSGGQFIIVEIAGANKEEVQELLAKQGKFEAKVGNETVFLGGSDITYVCRTSQCSGIDPHRGCGVDSSGTNYCAFFFQISLSQEAAQRMADVTGKLDVVYEQSAEGYLSEPIELYLDDVLVDSLNIGAGLKGVVQTDISIQGSGSGRDRREALTDTNEQMKRLQTVLVTGSLPVKLEIIKTDTISPSLGKEFLQNAFMISILSIIAVTAIVLIRYRRVQVAVPIIVIITSEILLILGVSALLRQNIDIAGIAGILVAIGTGVDDQIVITDETLKKEKEYQYMNWKQKLKKAFFIVMAAYFATVASMVPLLFAGAGLLKGFAITTIIGVTNGVLITRPAFGQMIEILLGDE